MRLRPGCDAIRPTTGRGHGELAEADDRARSDSPNLVRTPALLGEPEVAIRPSRDASREAPGRGHGELCEAACGGDAPDIVPIELSKPEVAIRPGCDAIREAPGRGHGELGDGSSGG